MDENDLAKQRNMYVVKSNDMIQKSRYELSLQEQKILLRIIQMIDMDDDNFKEYQLSLSDMCEFCGIGISGKNYTDLKKTLLHLECKRWWMVKDNGIDTEDVTVGWIRKTKIIKNKGIVKIQLDEDLKPYLLQLKNYFTKYCLFYTIAMKSKYSVRFYEIFKSYENLHKLRIDIDKLKYQLMADKYVRWADFKRKVLEIGLCEINLLTDISVSYKIEKAGRRIQYLIFEIKTKEDVCERLDAWSKIEERLSKKEIKSGFDNAVESVIVGDNDDE